MTGIALITKERKEQLYKHGISVSSDVSAHPDRELSQAARALLLKEPSIVDFPFTWRRIPKVHFMVRKTYKERLIIAGALIAAELDRINNLP
jgi:hypothetical protein